MSTAPAPVPIGPTPYVDWRATAMGRITEALEHRLLLELIGDPAGRAVLDVGCGDGALTVALAARGARACGIDVDPAMLAAGRTRATAQHLDVCFVEGRVEALPFADATFDVVCAVTVLCFVPDAAAAVRELARVLRPGGRLVIGELGRWSIWAARRRIRGWLGAATWRAARFRTAHDLRALLARAGLTVTVVRGAIYYPPVGPLARAMAQADAWFARLGTFGAAFIAVSAERPLRS